MKPIEEFINKVICGDVLEVLSQIPNSCIDLGITSPPYNKKEKHGGWLVPKVVYTGAKDKREEEDYQNWQVEVLNELYRVIKEGGSFFYNHKVRYENRKMIHPISWLVKTKWTIWQEIIWHRKIAGNIRGWRFWQVEERIYWLVKGKPEELKPRHAKLTSVWEIRPEQSHKDHPAVFPIELPTRIIYSVLEDKPGTVIDPFCGTGTTLVASKLLNKDFIGIDISQEYVQYAIKRLENAESEKPRVISEINKHIVELTFEKRKKMGLWDKRIKNK
ncbi:MAG: site-specific DNA-methyltransferase [candidate division WOR-3 bacterium]|nr:site-specific DNA-methyltransferase [candidate division WOR-3 bacterium]